MIGYEVVYSDRARDDLDRAYLGALRRTEVERATYWYETIQKDVQERLSLFPESFAISEDGCAVYPGTKVRQWIWGRGNAAFRVYFFVIPPREEEGETVGVVRVLRIRPAVRRPLIQVQEADEE